MEQAGVAIAKLAPTLVNPFNPSILLLAGPGNNGGDAFVAARHLMRHWHALTVVFAGDPASLPPDARQAYESWLACGGSVCQDIPDDHYGLVIDGLFGIGLTRPLQGHYAELIAQANQLDATRLSIDIPSGLCADTGRVLGCAIRADHTLTFIGLKPGLFTLDGVDYAGQVHLDELGTTVADATGWLVDTQPCPLPPRKRNSHKGSYGNVAIIGGNSGMVGAALLAGRAALLAGSGRVFCHLQANNAPLLDMAYPELMLRHADAALADNINSIIVGPGMGRSTKAKNILAEALQHPAPLVLDADALHLLAADAVLNSALRQRGNAVLTPHPGEAAALLHSDTATLQADRITSAQTIARQYNAVVILKGAGSVIAAPDGNWYINTSGNPGLSSAGMGDVLAGIIGALIAQGLDVEHATLLGAYLHGQAADRLVAQGIGPVGLTASEVAEEARNLLNQ